MSALFDAVEKNQVARIRELLRDSKTDVNWADDKSWTALHIAAGDNWAETVQALLAHPEIQPDRRNSHGANALMVASFTGHAQVVRVLMADDRVSPTAVDLHHATPLWEAAYWGFLEVVQWILASGRDPGLGLRTIAGREDWNGSSPLEIATRKRNHKVVDLLQRFAEDPCRTRFRLWRELRIQDSLAAELFALVVFHADGYVVLPAARGASTLSSEQEKQRRFFAIASTLPQELQMVLCNRALGLPGSTVPRKNSEAGFKRMATVIALGPAPKKS